MKSKNKKAIGMGLAVIIAVSVFTVAIPGTASESSNTLVAAEQTEEMGIEELQQWVYDQGYNYTVGENWITALSPEERQKLCGYKPLMPPTEPLPENVNFRSMVGIPESGRGVQSPVGLSPAYDAMALGYVTPVKDQSYPVSCGSCWIFGAIAEFESDVLINESVSNVTLNFSEQEVGDCNIWSRFCNGGNAYMTTNYFTKNGSADEACHPYAATPQTCQNCPILKNVDNWRIITGYYGESQITTIKNAILNYGPVYSTINASGPSFSLYDSGVYEWWDFTGSTNHAIEIIGWNDSLLHSHGEGAWLIKNSWGTDWGRNSTYPGCAWVAYGAANIGDYTSAISCYNNASRQIYYHDEYGWMGYGYGYNYYTTAWGAVRFIPTQNGQLKSVDFWSNDVNMQYEIKVFDNISSGASYTFSDQLGTTQTGSATEIGYYSIPLDTPIPLVTGDDFIVQVKLTTSTPGWYFPIPIDYAQHSDWFYSDWHAVGSGESYTSSNGIAFYKLNISGNDIDAGIRARMGVTLYEPSIEVNKTVLNETSGEWEKEVTVRLNDTVRFRIEIHNNATCCNLTDIRFWDNLSCSMEYVNNASLRTPYGKWIDIDLPGNFTFKPMILHPLNPEWSPYEPICNAFEELCPEPEKKYHLSSWEDTNGDGKLSHCDQIEMRRKVVDQQQVQWRYIDALQHIPLLDYQSFVPAVPILDAVQVALWGTGGPPVTVTIYGPEMYPVGSSTLFLGPLGDPYTPTPVWVQFHFTPPVELIPGQTYYIEVTTEGKYYWFFIDYDNYLPGWMWMDDGLYPNRDWTFKTEFLSIDWYHVELLPYTLNLTNTNTGNTTYFNSELDYQEIELNAPVGTQWNEVCCCEDSYLLKAWEDNGNRELDFCDYILLQNKRTGEETEYHVEEVTIDLVVSREWEIDDWLEENLILEPCQNVTIEFDANVTEYGDDWNYACAKGWCTDTQEWVWKCDSVDVYVPVPSAITFDTGPGTYPSIFGTHNGTITPNVTIYNVSRLYTYPCAGTGGHSESVAFFNATTEIEIANGTWNGYQGAGDYHYIELNVPITLQANEPYNYTIRTGSYPQIHHNKTLATANGWINCTKFTDANGKEYTDWIPAIKLE